MSMIMDRYQHKKILKKQIKYKLLLMIKKKIILKIMTNI